MQAGFLPGMLGLHDDAHQVSSLLKPRLRGVLHEYSFFVSLGSGLMLVLASSPGPGAELPRPSTPRRWRTLRGKRALPSRRVAAAGWCMDAAAGPRHDLPADRRHLHAHRAADAAPPEGPGAVRTHLGSEPGGIVLNLVWINAPRLVSPVLYVVLGWIAVAALPDLLASVSLSTLLLLTSGGVVYSVGALVYATRRPNPAPACVRLPRGLPRAHDRGREHALRGRGERCPACSCLGVRGEAPQVRACRFRE